MESGDRDHLPLPVIVSGPSGVGKGTLISRLLQHHPDVFMTTTSHTTREPRPGELSATTNTYHFVDFAEFQSLIDKNAFVEYTSFAGNHYGTSWQTVLENQDKKKVVILDIDMDGVKNVRNMSKDFAVRCAFITPPSMQALEDRLKARGTETEKTMRARLARAQVEITFADTRGVDDILIVNDDLDSAYRRLEQWILEI